MLNGIKKIKLPRNPFILFAPFLLLYIVWVIVFPSTGTFGDENRYILYADYMLNIYDPAMADGFDHLGNGPGYSIVLIPFVALHLPLLCITLLNAVLYYLSVVLVFKVLLRLSSFKYALLLSLFWACYFNSYEYLNRIYTETLCEFLVCLMAYCTMNAFKAGKLKASILPGFILGYMALTKPIFGYVLMCMLIVAALLWLVNRKVPNYRKALLILLVSFATTAPYLAYTYSVTGKAFYWSSFGGNNLYWMSSPIDGEYGDWIRDPEDLTDADFKNIENSKNLIIANHKEDYAEFNKYEGMEKDDAFKRAAIRNIKNHPVKFIQNCFYNAGRIFFNTPYSYTLQKPSTLMRLPFNGIIIVLGLFCIIPTFINWKNFSFPLRFLLFMGMLYLGGSILGAAETRMFTIVVPVLLAWIAFVFHRTVRINFNFKATRDAA